MGKSTREQGHGQEPGHEHGTYTETDMDIVHVPVQVHVPVHVHVHASAHVQVHICIHLCFLFHV